jgi:hypothetical protein
MKQLSKYNVKIQRKIQLQFRVLEATRVPLVHYYLGFIWSFEFKKIEFALSHGKSYGGFRRRRRLSTRIPQVECRRRRLRQLWPQLVGHVPYDQHRLPAITEELRPLQPLYLSIILSYAIGSALNSTQRRRYFWGRVADL